MKIILDIPIVTGSRIYAIAAHNAVGQVRKYTNEPYWHHPDEVAEVVATIPGSTRIMQAAAYLHDTIEDTKTKYDDLKMLFGSDVADLVVWLTDVSKPSDGNRKIRKAIDRKWLSSAPSEAQTIKCVDIWSNVKSIVTHDPSFAKIYVPEKKELLQVLTKANEKALKMATEIVSQAEKQLNF